MTASEVTEVQEPRPELTLVELQKAVWLTARSHWEDVHESDRAENWRAWCASGINEVLNNLNLPNVRQDAAYIDAWLEFNTKWDSDGTSEEHRLTRFRDTLHSVLLSGAHSAPIDVKNAWLTSWGLPPLPRRRTRLTLRLGIEEPDGHPAGDHDAVLAAITEALKPWFGREVSWY